MRKEITITREQVEEALKYLDCLDRHMAFDAAASVKKTLELLGISTDERTNEYWDGATYICKNGGVYEIRSAFGGYYGHYTDRFGHCFGDCHVWTKHQPYKTKKACAAAIERKSEGGHWA